MRHAALGAASLNPGARGSAIASRSGAKLVDKRKNTASSIVTSAHAATGTAGAIGRGFGKRMSSP